MTITLLLLTHNSNLYLKDNFTWLKNSKKINEVVVVDDNSTEDTKKLLSSLLPKNIKLVFIKNKLADFSTQRSLGLSASTNDWILWLDPDEKVEKTFKSFIDNFNPEKGTNSYSFPRIEYFLNHELKHGETSSLKFIRLFNKKHGVFNGKVHEKWVSTGKCINLNYPILHYGNSDINLFLHKINLYSSIRARELFDKGTKSNLLNILSYPVAKFIYTYIFKQGFKDGLAGTSFAFLMSFHSFLVRSKLWQLHNSSSSPRV